VGGSKISRFDCEWQGGKLLRLLSGLRPSIRPHITQAYQTDESFIPGIVVLLQLVDVGGLYVEDGLILIHERKFVVLEIVHIPGKRMRN
jgi:hypothetical protein